MKTVAKRKSRQNSIYRLLAALFFLFLVSLGGWDSEADWRLIISVVLGLAGFISCTYCGGLLPKKGMIRK